VFTARYALSPYIKQIRFVFKGLISGHFFAENKENLKNLQLEYKCPGRFSNLASYEQKSYRKKLRGEKHYTASVVDGWMSMEHWWNDTDRGN
jgi:hypothetical protein